MSRFFQAVGRVGERWSEAKQERKWRIAKWQNLSSLPKDSATNPKPFLNKSLHLASQNYTRKHQNKVREVLLAKSLAFAEMLPFQASICALYKDTKRWLMDFVDLFAGVGGFHLALSRAMSKHLANSLCANIDTASVSPHTLAHTRACGDYLSIHASYTKIPKSSLANFTHGAYLLAKLIQTPKKLTR